MALTLAALVLLYSFQSLFLKLYTSARNGEGELQFSIVYGLVAGICTLAFAGFGYAPSLTTVVLGVLNALILLVYNISLSRAANLGSYAFVMICNLSGGIMVPMVYDMFYLGNMPGALHAIAAVMMLAAFVVMNLDGIKEKKSGKYLLWCLSLFFVNGTYGVIMNLQQTLMDFTQRSEMIITVFLCLGLGTALPVLAKSPKKFAKGFKMSKKAAFFMVMSAVCATIAVNMLLYAMKSINITVLSVVDNGGVLVLSVIFAFVLFREKPAPHTVVGILMAGASIVMMSI